VFRDVPFPGSGFKEKPLQIGMFLGMCAPGCATARALLIKKARKVVITMFYVLIGIVYGVLGALVAGVGALRKA